MNKEEAVAGNHFVLSAHAKHSRVNYGVFCTREQAEDALGGFVEDSSIDADYWCITAWCRTEVLAQWTYERIVTFRLTNVEWK